MSEPTRPAGTQTLANGIAVLRAVADGAESLAAVAESTGLSRSTAHRLIQALRAERLLGRSADALTLGPSLIEFGVRALGENRLTVVAKPILEELAGKVLDTVHLAVADAGSVLYLVKVPGTRGAEMRSRVGYRMPFTRTGVGKALLFDKRDEWPAIWDADAAVHGGGSGVDEFLRVMAVYRAQGYAYDLEENEPGIRCVAAPVRDATGEIVGAISIAATMPYMPMKRMRALPPVVVATAATISREMGYRTWSP